MTQLNFAEDPGLIECFIDLSHHMSKAIQFHGHFWLSGPGVKVQLPCTGLIFAPISLFDACASLIVEPVLLVSTLNMSFYLAILIFDVT